MFTEYSTLKTYRRLHNSYDTIGNTTKIPIEGIGNVTYTLNEKQILSHNVLHVTALRGPIYSLRKHHQWPGCGVYSSYKDGSYLFLPEILIQIEDSFDNIIRYRSLRRSH